MTATAEDAELFPEAPATRPRLGDRLRGRTARRRPRPAQPDELRPDGPRRIPYQPALDGLRGVAVAAVVLYHGEVRFTRGGYLGVDAFFVLSGFLITTLLLAEWRERDTIDLARFWLHRIRRLVPPLLLTVVLVSLFAVFVAKPDIKDQLRWDGISSVLYVANWRLIASAQSYFDRFFASPFRHMWSLSIEEQYYLVWPLITVAVLHLRRSVRAMLVLSTVLAAGSAILMALLYDPAVDPSRLYYGTDTRAQSLLVGSALAAALASGFGFRSARAKLALGIGSVVASVLLAYAWARVADTDALLYRGGFLLHALLVGVVILACTQLSGGPVRTALSFEPLRRLGLISYGVYLYHWPIFIWLDADRTGLESGSLALLGLRIGVTLAVAVLSYRLIEQPIRQGVLRRRGLPAWLAPVAVGSVLVLLVATTAGARATLAVTEDLDASKRPPPSGALADDPDRTRVLLVGDSVAYTLGVGFEGTVADEQDLAFWNQAVLFCELVVGERRENGATKPASDTCPAWRDDWRSAVEVFEPDVSVLLIGAWEIFDRRIDGQWVEFGTPAYDAVLEPTLQEAVDVLSAGGAPVVLVTSPRFGRTDPNHPPEWGAEGAGRVEHLNEVLRRVAERNPGRVVLVDLGGFICPDGDCPREIDGVRMRDDGLHYRDEDARVVAAWLAPRLRDIAAGAATGAPTGSTPPGTVPPGTVPSGPGDVAPPR